MRLMVKYCGGCKSCYDRPGLVQDLIARLEELGASPVQVVSPPEQAPSGVVVCGCPTCCADRPENRQGAAASWVVGPGLLDYLSLPPSSLVSELATLIMQQGGHKN